MDGIRRRGRRNIEVFAARSARAAIRRARTRACLSELRAPRRALDTGMTSISTDATDWHCVARGNVPMVIWSR
jgi:hypothetical protein